MVSVADSAWVRENKWAGTAHRGKRLLGWAEWPWRAAGLFTGGQISKCLQPGTVQTVVKVLSVCLKQEMFTGETNWIRRYSSERINCLFLCPSKSQSCGKVPFYHKITKGRQGFFAPTEIPACRVPSATFRVWGSTLNLVFLAHEYTACVGREDWRREYGSSAIPE